MRKINSNIKVLIVGSCISSIGDWINILALMALIVKLADKGTALATLMILRALPKIIFGPIIAGLIDYLDKKRILIVTCILQGILVLFIPLASNIYWIYIISFLLAVINIFVSPTIRSIIPIVVSKDELIAVNSLFSSISSIISIASPALSGLILSMLGLSICFYIDSLTFVIFCVFILFLNLNSACSTTLKVNFKYSNILNGSKESFKYILKNLQLNMIIKGVFLANLSMGIIYVSEIVFFKNVLKIDPNIYGTFVAIVGVGILIGSIIIRKLNKRNLYNIFSFGIVIMGIGIILFSINTNLYIAAGLLVIEGLGEAFFSITSVTIIQKNTLESNRAGVLTFNDALVKSAFIISMGISGILIDIISAKYTILMSGIISAIYFIIWIKNAHKVEKASALNVID